MKLDLKDAIEKLYVAFSEAEVPRRPEQIDACPCCVSEDELRALVATDRRRLSCEVMRPYIHTARGPVTGKDFLYFFPRIMEVMYVEEYHIDPEPVFERLGSVEAKNLSPRQRSGLAEFMSSMIAEAARLLPEGSEEASDAWLIDEFVCCAALSGLEMKPHFEKMLEYPQLVRVFYAANRDAETGRFNNYFWGTDSYEARAEIVAWLRSDPVLAILTEPRS